MVNIYAQPLDFGCKKGEAIFHQKMDEIITEPEFSKLLVEFQSYLQRLASLQDDRLYALVADLMVENIIDDFLSELMPKHNESEIDRKFTLSSKIDVAKELRLSPPKLFDGAKVINQVRNDFAII
jgi:hypothetical protein